jgi:hypothetical protein
VSRDATVESAESALRASGVDVARDSSARGGFTSLKGEREGWTIAVYFDAAGKTLINVVVTSTHGSQEIGDASEARLRKRLGVPGATVKAVEQAWRRREGEPKAHAPGGLEWGMTPPKAKAALDAIGFETKGGAAASAAMLTSTKVDRTIRLSFSDAEGLTEAVMRCEGEPRFDEVQKALGNPRSTTTSTILRWSPAGSDVELYVDEKIPGAAWTVRETYTLKKR